MTDLRLRTVTRTQGANQALKEGTVAARAATFAFEEVPVLVQAFRRMVRAQEYDVSEMAFTTYLCAKAHDKPFTALPVFLVRGFHHGAVVRGADAPRLAPTDLEGRRVGVNRGYTVTTGVWARGILQDEYGVDLDRITWVRSGDEHVEEYRHPDNVVPMAAGERLPDLVARGELAAGIGLAADDPGLVPLVPDPEGAALEALRRRGLYPINHLVVVKDELLAAHPELAVDVFEAFAEAKRLYVERLHKDDIEEPSPADLLHRQVMEATGDDPLPYGIAHNRPMIDELIRHAVRQRILDRPVPVESLFAESTHHLTA